MPHETPPAIERGDVLDVPTDSLNGVGDTDARINRGDVPIKTASGKIVGVTGSPDFNDDPPYDSTHNPILTAPNELENFSDESSTLDPSTSEGSKGSLQDSDIPAELPNLQTANSETSFGGTLETTETASGQSGGSSATGHHEGPGFTYDVLVVDARDYERANSIRGNLGETVMGQRPTILENSSTLLEGKGIERNFEAYNVTNKTILLTIEEWLNNITTPRGQVPTGVHSYESPLFPGQYISQEDLYKEVVDIAIAEERGTFNKSTLGQHDYSTSDLGSDDSEILSWSDLHIGGSDFWDSLDADEAPTPDSAYDTDWNDSSIDEDSYWGSDDLDSGWDTGEEGDDGDWGDWSDLVD